MINENTAKLLDLFMTSEYEKKQAMYAGVSVYVLNHDKDIIDNFDNESLVKVRIKEIAYKLNNSTVIDVDLLQTMFMKFYKARKDVLNVSGRIGESQTLQNVFGISDIFGSALELVEKNFRYFRKVYNLLSATDILGLENETVSK
jgi:hypothetical protein